MGQMAGRCSLCSVEPNIHILWDSIPNPGGLCWLEPEMLPGPASSTKRMMAMNLREEGLPQGQEDPSDSWQDSVLLDFQASPTAYRPSVVLCGNAS